MSVLEWCRALVLIAWREEGRWWGRGGMLDGDGFDGWALVSLGIRSGGFG